MGPLSKNIGEGKCQRHMVRRYLMLLALTLVAGSASAQNIELEPCSASAETVRVLGAGERIASAMKANELHLYQVTLAANQYVHVVVEQKGIDVVVSVRDPGGVVLFSRDSPNGKVGPEQISVKAQSAGTYQIGVCTGRTEPDGNYEISLDGPRAPTATDEKRLEAEALQRGGGEEFRINGSPSTAKERYEQALKIWQELGDNQEQGYILCAIGEMHRFQRDFTNSMSNFDKALLCLQAANDKSGQAYVQNAMAAAQRDLTTEPAKAMEYYDAAISLRTSIGDRWGEVHARNNIGHLYSRLGKNLAALDNLKGLLSLWQDLGARDQELNTRNNIATANIDLGNVSAAYQDFQDLLAACQKDKAFCTCEPEKPFCLEGSIHNGLGMVYEVWGRLSDAINEYNQAINSFSQQKEKGEPGKAKVINNLGLLLASINDPEAALDQFQTALSLKQSFGDEALTRSNIGYVKTLQNHQAEALDQLEKALKLSENSNERIKAYTLTRLGGAYALSSDKLKALSYYNQALDLIRAIGDVRAEALTLDKMAQLNASMGQIVKARQLYLDAQKRSQELKDIQGEAAALYGLAQLARRERNFTQACEHIVAAIQKVESLRTSTANYRFRRTYFESRYDYYALETDIRMQIYFDLRAKNDLSGAQEELDAALFAAERARARNLLDVLMESRADIRHAEGVDQQLLNTEREQQNKLSEKLELLQNMLAEKGKEKQKADLEREVRSLDSELAGTQGKIREQSRQYAALTQAKPLEPAEIRKLLDEDTCILQYAIGDERSYLWLITVKEIIPYSLPGQAAIKKATSALTEAIRIYEPRKTSDAVARVQELRQAMPTFQRRARELSNIILAPVASKITSKRLVIVADGDLQYIPFAALPVPNTPTVKAKQEFTYLIAKHEILYEPSASALGLLRQHPPGKATQTVAVIADPVFSKGDERVKNGPLADKAERASSLEDVQLRQIFRGSGDTANSTLVRLRYSRVEAEAIKAAAPAGSFMEALDFDANRDTVLSDQLKQFKIIHLATHGIVNASHPELSALVFSLVNKDGQSRPGFLRLNDIYNLNLAADLVVLSACETGIGQEFRSEGLLGLTRGFMYAGAERVVATLWKVNDVATSELMKRFYTYMLSEGKPASVALRQAQLDMIKSGGETQAPFFWAGFVLQGEWK